MADITGSKPVNNAVISTNIQIKIGTWVIGYIRNITETQARPANPQYEVGTVGPIDIIPAQPAAVTLACTKVAIYGGNMINIIGKALNSNNLANIEAAPGLTQAETKTALSYWLGQQQGTPGDITAIFSIAQLPVGFLIEIDERYPIPDGSVVMKSEYHNCWVVRYTRPIIASGDLLVAEACDINCQYVKYSGGRSVTAGNVEVVS